MPNESNGETTMEASSPSDANAKVADGTAWLRIKVVNFSHSVQFAQIKAFVTK